MRILALALFVLHILLPVPPPAWSLEKDTKPGALETQPVITWHEGDERRTAWMSPDETALFRKGGRGRSLPTLFQEQVRTHVAKEDILFLNPFVAIVHVPDSGKGELPFLRDLPTRDGLEMAESPVFYPQPEKIPSTRMALTGEVVVHFSEEPERSVLDLLTEKFQLQPVKVAPFAPLMYVFKAPSPRQSLEQANALHASGLVLGAWPNWYRARAVRLTNDPLSSRQWHLSNQGQGGGTPGADVNIGTAWEAYPGSPDQVIAIVDDGLEIEHEDLRDNVRPGLSWDWVEGKDDPSGSSRDTHGTSCAGVAAARGFNELGVIGAAPLAGLAGMRVLGAETDVNEAEALSLHHDVVSIYSNSWGPIDDGQRLEGPGPLTREALRNGAINGRGGKGNIFVWAGGNGRQSSDNSNYDGYANQRYVIAVAASTDEGSQAGYSEPGANLLVNVPSSGGRSAVTTTARMAPDGSSMSNYTEKFGGTSAAAPLAAGIVALMLHANPDLTWRDVRWILAGTATKNDEQDPDWSRNGAGLWVNHNHGFGRMDASAAVIEAALWGGLPPEQSVEARREVNESIPDDDPTGVTSDITISDQLVVEFVDVYFSASDHTYWGDLEVVLTSPAGIKSILAQKHTAGRSYRYDNWRFGSSRHMGESSQGQWTLTVRDLWAQDTGTFKEWTLVVHGHPQRKPVKGPNIAPALMLILDDED